MRHLIAFIALNIPGALVIAYAIHRGLDVQPALHLFHRLFF